MAMPQAHAAISHLIKICGQEDDDAKLSAEAICFELIAMSGSIENKERVPPRWLAVAVEYLHDNVCGGISVGEIGARIGVHPIHLARVFRRFYGCTPGDYLRDLRIRRSQALLSQTRRTLFEVACATGFADQSHFTKQFSAALGIPPGEYRRLTSIHRVASDADAPSTLTDETLYKRICRVKSTCPTN
jgi:AraC family transcriptional regulator